MNKDILMGAITTIAYSICFVLLASCIAVFVQYLITGFKNPEVAVEGLQFNESTLTITDSNINDASLIVKPNTEKVFFITAEVEGVKLDKDKLYSQICDKMLSKTEINIEIPTIKIKPKITKDDLLRFTYLRSDFSTSFKNSSKNRKHNIKNALNSINKIELAPNEIFSFNKIVGRRTESNGYRSAKIIVDNEFVDGIGGGVCQVSSTLYNSALLAGLEILEANKHSKQVSYVKYGFDAMVNFGSSDLKFRNNTSGKITIITNYISSNMRIRIFGESLMDTKYVLSNEIVLTEKPIEEIQIDEKQKYLDKVRYEDEYFYLKKPVDGMHVKSYREKYISGKLVNKELLRFDKFKPQNAIKVYGAEKRTMSIFEELTQLKF